VSRVAWRFARWSREMTPTMIEVAIKTVLPLALVGLAAAYARAAGAGSARPGPRRCCGEWATMGTPRPNLRRVGNCPPGRPRISLQFL